MIDSDGEERPEAISIQKVIDQYVQEFIDNGKKIGENGLAVGSGGNMSIKVPGGILVTSTGSNLSNLKPDDLVFVYEADENNVYYAGHKKPSSETINHWMIFKERKDIEAISHVNVGPKDEEHIVTTKKEIPYGTIELGRVAVNLLQKEDVIMLKDHGVIAVGKNLTEATNLLIESTDKEKPYIFGPITICPVAKTTDQYHYKDRNRKNIDPSSNSQILKRNKKNK
jgi:L-fuculose-phosphate aldolase